MKGSLLTQGNGSTHCFPLYNSAVGLNSSLVHSDEHNGSCCARDPPFSYGYSTWASEAWLGSRFPPEAFPGIPISLPGLWALLCAAIDREHLRTLMSMLAAQPRGKETGSKLQSWNIGSYAYWLYDKRLNLTVKWGCEASWLSVWKFKLGCLSLSFPLNLVLFNLFYFLIFILYWSIVD